MKKLSLFQREPAVIISSITALVTAVIGLAVAFGLPISPDQQTAILAFTGAVLVLIFGNAAVTRKSVTANDRVVESLDDKTGEVVAGPANELVTRNTVVREYDKAA